jgi:predicted ATP-dependent serine protease
MVIKKALTVANVINQKVTLIDFSESSNDLYQALGNPQNKGVWFIWGSSGSGKSSLLLDITKAFCKTLKAIHNELEEDLDDLDFINRLKLKNMQDVKNNFLAASYTYEQLCAYLDKRDSPKVVIINSATYFFENIQQYHEFSNKYKRRKIIIITGMAKGNNPYSELETKIMYDANKKIFVSGYLASCKGRTIGPNGGTYIIWQEGFEKVRGAERN